MADDVILNSMTGGDTVAADDIGGIKFQRVKIVHGIDGTNDGDSALTNGFPIRAAGSSTTIQTTTTPLADGATFTGQAFDTAINGHGFTVSAKADRDGHTYHDQSINGTDWIASDDYAYIANEGHHEEHIAHMRYTRFRFVNSAGAAQGSFVFSVVQRFMDGFGTVKIAETDNEVKQGADAPWEMQGEKANNAVIPDATNIGVLPAVCHASPPTYTDTYQVGQSVTTSGDTRVTLDGESVTVTATNLDVRDLTGTDVVTVTGGAGQIADVKVTLDSETVTIGALPNEGQQTMANSISVAVASDQTTLPAGGNVAHAAADSGNPLKVGAKVETSLSTITIASDGNRTDLYADSDGVQYVKLFSEADLITERVSDTAGNSTAFTNFGATASARNLVYGYSVFNSSATDGFLDFRDGTAGAILWTVPLPKGGGANLAFPGPIFKTTANTALAYDVSAALTTVYISIMGRKSKVT